MLGGRPAAARGSRATDWARSSVTRRLAIVAPQPEDAEQERREEDLHTHDEQRRRGDRQALLREGGEVAAEPLDDDHRTEDEASECEPAAEEQSVLEPEAAPHPVEPRVALAHEVFA